MGLTYCSFFLTPPPEIASRWMAGFVDCQLANEPPSRTISLVNGR
jgi:hypothetical protein